jgi:hypothetical protein
MTQVPDKEDEQWLNALAGRSDESAEPNVIQQADALRRALKVRQEMLNKKVPEADASQYQQLMFRLRKEGLTTTQSGWRNPMQWGLAAKRAVRAVVATERHSPVMWGLAATVVIGVAVVIQMGGLHSNQNDADILLGGQSTLLTVDEPEIRLAELLVGLKTVGEVPTVKREPEGRIVLTIRGTDRVLEYLASGSHPIEPMLVQGNVIIELRPAKSPK